MRYRRRRRLDLLAIALLAFSRLLPIIAPPVGQRASEVQSSPSPARSDDWLLPPIGD